MLSVADEDADCLTGIMCLKPDFINRFVYDGLPEWMQCISDCMNIMICTFPIYM